MSDKQYLGIVRTKSGQYGDYLTLSIGPRDADAVRIILAKLDGGQWATVAITRRKTPDGDKTHTASIMQDRQRDAGNDSGSGQPF